MTQTWRNILSIQLVKSDSRSLYLCGIPVLLADNFNGCFFKIVYRQFPKQSYDLVERQTASGFDKNQALRLAVRMLDLAFLVVVD